MQVPAQLFFEHFIPETESISFIFNSFIFSITIFSIINFIWWITDIINFSLNRYADGNGIPLLEW